MAGKETSKPPGGAPSLDAQLDKLVTEASSPAKPAALKAATKTKAPAEPHDESFKQAVNQIAAVPATGANTDEPEAVSPADLAGDDLANQIQELLDSAKESTAVNDPSATGTDESVPEIAGDMAAPEAIEAADQESPTLAAHAAKLSDVSASPSSSSSTMSSVTNDSATAVADKASINPAEQTAPAAADSAEKADTSASAKADAASVEQIDQMLAENADDAIAGEFETAAEVIAAESDPTAEPAPPPPSAGGGKIVIETNAKATRHDADSSAADVHDATPAEEEDLAGAFESPEDVLSDEHEHTKLVPVADAENTDAAPEGESVSIETTETPAAQAPAAAPGPATARQAAAPRPAKPAAPAEPAPPRLPSAHRRPSIIKRLCALINAPLANAQPWVRDGIGWIAIITLFNGAVFVGMEISSNAMGGNAPSIDAPHGEHGSLPSPSDHAAAKDSHGSPSHGEKKSDAHGEAKKSDSHGSAKNADDAHGKKPDAKKSAKPDSHAKKDAGHGGH